MAQEYITDAERHDRAEALKKAVQEGRLNPMPNILEAIFKDIAKEPKDPHAWAKG